MIFGGPFQPRPFYDYVILLLMLEQRTSRNEQGARRVTTLGRYTDCSLLWEYLELELRITGPLAWRCCYHLGLSFSFTGANLTEKIRKIKIVFTPTICKQTCRSGRCYNSCEKGDTTTLYSQGGHDHDPKSGFRICEHPQGSQLISPAPLLSSSLSYLSRLSVWAATGLRGDGLSQCLGRCLLGSLGLMPPLSLGEEDRPCLIVLCSGQATSISIPPQVEGMRVFESGLRPRLATPSFSEPAHCFHWHPVLGLTFII